MDKLLIKARVKKFFSENQQSEIGTEDKKEKIKIISF